MSQPFVHTDSVSSPSSSATPKARPALKLVKTNTLKRDDWLEVRKGGIGVVSPNPIFFRQCKDGVITR